MGILSCKSIVPSTKLLHQVYFIDNSSLELGIKPVDQVTAKLGSRYCEEICEGKSIKMMGSREADEVFWEGGWQELILR